MKKKIVICGLCVFLWLLSGCRKGQEEIETTTVATENIVVTTESASEEKISGANAETTSQYEIEEYTDLQEAEAPADELEETKYIEAEIVEEQIPESQELSNDWSGETPED